MSTSKKHSTEPSKLPPTANIAKNRVSMTTCTVADHRFSSSVVSCNICYIPSISESRNPQKKLFMISAGHRQQ